jgi:hypothetical protein
MVATREKINGVRPDDLIDPNTMVNPSSNMIARNPTRVDLSKDADDQREIVSAIKDAQARRMKVFYEYKHLEDGSWEFTGLPGLIKFHEMSDPELVEFCRTMMRCKPNITGIELSLGKYNDIKEYTGPKIGKLNFRKPRYPTEVAEDWASLIGDKALRVVKVQWQIKSAGPGAFECIGKAWTTSEDEYNDKEKFSPSLDIEYFSL